MATCSSLSCPLQQISKQGWHQKNSVSQYLLPTAHCPGSYLLPIAHDPLSIAQAAGEENLGKQSFTEKSQSLTSFRGIAFAFLLDKLVTCEGK